MRWSGKPKQTDSLKQKGNSQQRDNLKQQSDRPFRQGLKNPMSPSSKLQTSIPHSSVSHVVSAGIRLYLTHFLQFLTLSTIAVFWSPGCSLLIYAIAGIVSTALQNHYVLSILLIPIWIGLALYCIAESMANSAAIAKLAFSVLTHQPETIQSAKRFTRLRMWKFLSINLPLRFFLGGIGFAIIFLTELAFLALPTGLSVIYWIVAMGLILLMTWLLARLVILELPLAVESNSRIIRSIKHGWVLTRRRVWRILLILFLAFLLILFLAFIAASPLILLTRDISIYFEELSAKTTFPNSSIFYTVTPVITKNLRLLVMGILILPLWQSIRAIIYYDLRDRSKHN